MAEPTKRSTQPPPSPDQPRVADGAWSSELYSRGFDRQQPAETANLTRPDIVEQLAADYATAGATILTTNTFAANRIAATRRGIDTDLHELNAVAAQIVRKTAEKHAAIAAGTIGPSGAIVAIQEASEAELTAAFSEQAAALVEGGAQWLVLETFSELAELLIALRAVREVTSGPIVASMSFDSGPQRTKTVMGVSAAEAAKTLEDAGADLIGANCGAGIATALPAVVALHSNSSRPIWVKPSAGLPDLEDGVAVYHHKPDQIDGPVHQLLDAGVSVLGGCCGMGPAHIKRMAALVAAHRHRRGKK